MEVLWTLYFHLDLLNLFGDYIAKENANYKVFGMVWHEGLCFCQMWTSWIHWAQFALVLNTNFTFICHKSHTFGPKPSWQPSCFICLPTQFHSQFDYSSSFLYWEIFRLKKFGDSSDISHLIIVNTVTWDPVIYFHCNSVRHFEDMA